MGTSDMSDRSALTVSSLLLPKTVAPEVGLGEPYDESCDTFSFSVLLWEMMALERPYGNITPFELQSKVWGESCLRPRLDPPSVRPKQTNQIQPLKRRQRKQPWASTPLQILMKRGWSVNPQERPRMVHVESILKKECLCVRNGDESGLEHNQRRSTHVFARRTATARTL